MRDFLETLVQAGKIRWYGWSTVDHAAAPRFAQGAHCTAIQHWMNIGTDMPEMLQVCEQYDQASFVRSPLGSGNMTGKFNGDSVFPADDMRSTWDVKADRAMQRRAKIEAVRQYFSEIADPRSQAQIALAWIWTRSSRTVPIPGFKTMAQVKENIQAMDLGLLTREQMTRIDEIWERSPVSI